MENLGVATEDLGAVTENLGVATDHLSASSNCIVQGNKPTNWSQGVLQSCSTIISIAWTNPFGS